MSCRERHGGTHGRIVGTSLGSLGLRRLATRLSGCFVAASLFVLSDDWPFLLLVDILATERGESTEADGFLVLQFSWLL